VKVFQHGWVVVMGDGRTVRFVVFSKEDDWTTVPCFLCGDVCLTLQKTEDGNATWEVLKPLHPTADDQQHCADCCQGCRINRRKDVIL